MKQQVYTLTKEAPFLIFSASERSMLWVDRFVFNTDDPNWSRRLGGAQLFNLMTVNEDDDDGGITRSLQKATRSIGLLNRNTFIRPMFDIEGGWCFSHPPLELPDVPHTWIHSIGLTGSLKLKDKESIELTIRTNSEFLDVLGMIHDLNTERYIKQN